VTGPEVVDLHDPATLLAADTAALLPAAALAGAQVRSSAEQVVARGDFDRPRALVVIGANSAVDAALHTMAAALRDRTAELLAANAADVEAAERGGMTGGLLDRLRLTPERLADMAVQLEVLADTPEPPLQTFVRTLPTGERVFERRVPVGVIGAVFEARPNVTIDVASQVLKARSAAVLRTGAAALGPHRGGLSVPGAHGLHGRSRSGRRAGRVVDVGRDSGRRAAGARRRR